MNLGQFASKCDLVNKTETEKVAFLSFYFYYIEKKTEFGINDVITWFEGLGFTKPNTSRLVSNLIKSSLFTKGKSKDTFRLHAKQIPQFQTLLAWLDNPSEEIVFTGEILPETLFLKTRGYIEQLAKQINASYENNLFDGCAVLMRRLIEVLLIHSYQNVGEESKIKHADQYRDLSFIIKEAIANSKLNLSKGTKDCLDDFRELGNFSAHRIEYNCKRDDIKRVALNYRAAVEELLYKSAIRK